MVDPAMYHVAKSREFNRRGLGVAIIDGRRLVSDVLVQILRLCITGMENFAETFLRGSFCSTRFLFFLSHKWICADFYKI